MKVNLEIEENDLVLFPVSHFLFSILRFPCSSCFSFCDLCLTFLVILTFIIVAYTAVPAVDIYIRSVGKNDPNTLCLSYIKVNGREYSSRHRGHNVVIVDGSTGNSKVAEVLSLTFRGQENYRPLK